MKARHNSNITKLFKGIRMVRKRMGDKIEAVPNKLVLRLTKTLMKKFEKANTLTALQYGIVEVELGRSTEKTDPTYVARLCALLEKSMIKAKFDSCGNPVSNKVVRRNVGEGK